MRFSDRVDRGRSGVSAGVDNSSGSWVCGSAFIIVRAYFSRGIFPHVIHGCQKW
jgi:hypothetical protein